MRTAVKKVIRFQNARNPASTRLDNYVAFFKDGQEDIAIYPNDTEKENLELMLVMFTNVINSTGKEYISGEEWEAFKSTPWIEETKVIDFGEDVIK
jgi:hypothetical protein